MSSQYNTTATLDGLFKIVYGEGPVNAIPEVAIVQDKVPFMATERIGKSYNFPVILSSEAGVTYLVSGAGVQTLNSAVAAQLKEAQVDANQIIIRGQMDYEAAAKAVSSKQSFKNASEQLVENLMETGSRRLEIAFIYGQSATGLGVVSSSANSNTTTTVLQISDAQWAPGVWAGLENATIQAWKVSDNTLVSSGTDAVFTLSFVDFGAKKLTVTGSTTGIAALDTAAGAGNLYLTFNGAKTGTSTYAEPVGLDRIITNVGTLFNIPASTYSLWSGSSYSFGSAAITVAKVLNMAGLAVSKGGLMEEADLLLSPRTYMNLAGTITDLRRVNSGESSTEGFGGFESIVLQGPNGKMNLVVHPMIKEGECFLAPLKKRFKRIGSQEFSFETPGRKGELFLHVPDKNAYELRLYCAQQIICITPAKTVKGTSIVNS